MDKHSTGGVGDKITIPLVPVIAACGAAVPQAAGRGLGHTGGTLDKLESIPGFSAEVPIAQIRQQLSEIGAAIFAAGELAPADRKIYALRDVTATVESLPLIASSVMSKKLAEGADALVLDVKVGCGAFLKTEAESRELAATMVELGRAHGVPTRAVLTDMNTPLGRTVGNALEVAESLEVLAGGGPADVVELTLRLAAEMLELAGVDGCDPAQTLRDGTAMDRFRRAVAAQGGDVDAPLPIGAHSETVSAPRSGTMGDIDAMAVGLTVWRLGAGRARPGERVQSGAGVRIHRRPGEPVAAGEPLFTLYTDTPDRIPAAMAELDGGWSVGDDVRASPAAPSADHRSDHLMTTPLTSAMISRAPKALLHDHLDGGLRPATVLDIAGQIGYDGLPTTDEAELADVVPHRGPQRLAGALSGAVRAHRRRHADPGGAASGGVRMRGGPGRRQRRLRRGAVRARIAHGRRTVARRRGRRGAGRVRRRGEGRGRGRPSHHGALPGDGDAPCRTVARDRRAGDPVPRQGCRRLRHRRRRGRVSAHPASRRLRVHAKQQRPLHHSRR